jgi:methyl-accepting chemotaxis protein
VTGDWQHSVRNSDALAFSNLAVRLNDYQDSLYKLAPIVKQSGPKAAREWAAKNQPAEIRDALSKDLVALSHHYSDTASRIYTRIDKGIDDTAPLLSVLACSAIALALAGIVIIARSVTRPISDVTNVTEAVAAGERRHRHSIQRSSRQNRRARKNVELNRTVLNDADLRSQRQQDMANEISHFSSEVEATLAELGRISDEISPHRRSSEAQPTMHRQ